MRNLLVIISAFLFLSFSCTEEGNYSKLRSEKILFYVAYENHMWGHQFNGWFIDNQGNVWDLKSPVKWWNKEIDIDGFSGEYWIEQDSLHREYSSKANGIIYQLDQDKLEEGLALESKIKDISYSTPQNVMADAGTTIYGYLLYDPSKKAFRQIPLALEGDWEYHANSEEARQLKEWLFEIAVDITEKTE